MSPEENRSEISERGVAGIAEEELDVAGNEKHSREDFERLKKYT